MTGPATSPRPPVDGDPVPGVRDESDDAALELQVQEAAYRAALGAAERALQPSLLDFLR